MHLAAASNEFFFLVFVIRIIYQSNLGSGSKVYDSGKLCELEDEEYTKKTGREAWHGNDEWLAAIFVCLTFRFGFL